MSKIDQYAYSLSNNDSNFTQLNAQEEYIYSSLENKPVGMIIDGTYWWNEAKGAYERSVGQYGDRAKTRNFAWMPMPTAIGEADRVSGAKKPVVRDLMHSYAFINAKVSTDPYRTQLAKDFISFCYTDESLVNFTLDTGVPKGVKYTLSESDLAQLPYYQRSLMEVKSVSDVIYPYSDNPIFVNHQNVFAYNLGSKVWESNGIGELVSTITVVK